MAWNNKCTPFRLTFIKCFGKFSKFKEMPVSNGTWANDVLGGEFNACTPHVILWKSKNRIMPINKTESQKK